MLKRKKGMLISFTLIELLVVVSVIAVLIAILLPALQNARMSAQKIVCASKLRNIGQALTMYADDYNSAYPLNGLEIKGNLLYALNWYAYKTWPKGSLYELYKDSYMKDVQMFFCPSSGGNGGPEKSWPSPPDIWPGNRYWGNYSYLAASKKMNLSISFIGAEGHGLNNSHGVNSDPNTVTSADFFQEGHPTEYSFNHMGEGGNTLFNDGHVRWYNYEDQTVGHIYGWDIDGVYRYSRTHRF